MSALMLLLNVWSERRSERTISGPARDLALVQKSVEMLRAFKKEYVPCRICEIQPLTPRLWQDAHIRDHSVRSTNSASQLTA